MCKLDNQQTEIVERFNKTGGLRRRNILKNKRYRRQVPERSEVAIISDWLLKNKNSEKLSFNKRDE